MYVMLERPAYIFLETMDERREYERLRNEVKNHPGIQEFVHRRFAQEIVDHQRSLDARNRLLDRNVMERKRLPFLSSRQPRPVTPVFVDKLTIMLSWNYILEDVHESEDLGLLPAYVQVSEWMRLQEFSATDEIDPFIRILSGETHVHKGVVWQTHDEAKLGVRYWTNIYASAHHSQAVRDSSGRGVAD